MDDQYSHNTKVGMKSGWAYSTIVSASSKDSSISFIPGRESNSGCDISNVSEVDMSSHVKGASVNHVVGEEQQRGIEKIPPDKELDELKQADINRTERRQYSDPISSVSSCRKKGVRPLETRQSSSSLGLSFSRMLLARHATITGNSRSASGKASQIRSMSISSVSSSASLPQLPAPSLSPVPAIGSTDPILSTSFACSIPPTGARKDITLKPFNGWERWRPPLRKIDSSSRSLPPVLSSEIIDLRSGRSREKNEEPGTDERELMRRAQKFSVLSKRKYSQGDHEKNEDFHSPFSTPPRNYDDKKTSPRPFKGAKLGNPARGGDEAAVGQENSAMLVNAMSKKAGSSVQGHENGVITSDKFLSSFSSTPTTTLQSAGQSSPLTPSAVSPTIPIKIGEVEGLRSSSISTVLSLKPVEHAKMNAAIHLHNDKISRLPVPNCMTDGADESQRGGGNMVLPKNVMAKKRRSALASTSGQASQSMGLRAKNAPFMVNDTAMDVRDCAEGVTFRDGSSAKAKMPTQPLEYISRNHSSVNRIGSVDPVTTIADNANDVVGKGERGAGHGALQTEKEIAFNVAFDRALSSPSSSTSSLPVSTGEDNKTPSSLSSSTSFLGKWIKTSLARVVERESPRFHHFFSRSEGPGSNGISGLMKDMKDSSSSTPTDHSLAPLKSSPTLPQTRAVPSLPYSSTPLDSCSRYVDPQSANSTSGCPTIHTSSPCPTSIVDSHNHVKSQSLVSCKPAHSASLSIISAKSDCLAPVPMARAKFEATVPPTAHPRVSSKPPSSLCTTLSTSPSPHHDLQALDPQISLESSKSLPQMSTRLTCRQIPQDKEQFRANCKSTVKKSTMMSGATAFASAVMTGCKNVVVAAATAATPHVTFMQSSPASLSTPFPSALSPHPMSAASTETAGCYQPKNDHIDHSCSTKATLDHQPFTTTLSNKYSLSIGRRFEHHCMTESTGTASPPSSLSTSSIPMNPPGSPSSRETLFITPGSAAGPYGILSRAGVLPNEDDDDDADDGESRIVHNDALERESQSQKKNSCVRSASETSTVCIGGSSPSTTSTSSSASVPSFVLSSFPSSFVSPSRLTPALQHSTSQLDQFALSHADTESVGARNFDVDEAEGDVSATFVSPTILQSQQETKDKERNSAVASSWMRNCGCSDSCDARKVLGSLHNNCHDGQDCDSSSSSPSPLPASFENLMYAHRVLRPLPDKDPKENYHVMFEMMKVVSRRFDFYQVKLIAKDKDLKDHGGGNFFKKPTPSSKGKEKGNPDAVDDIDRDKNRQTRKSITSSQYPLLSCHSSCIDAESGKPSPPYPPWEMTQQSEVRIIRQKKIDPFSVFGPAPPEMHLSELYKSSHYNGVAPETRFTHPVVNKELMRSYIIFDRNRRLKALSNKGSKYDSCNGAAAVSSTSQTPVSHGTFSGKAEECILKEINTLSMMTLSEYKRTLSRETVQYIFKLPMHQEWWKKRILPKLKEKWDLECAVELDWRNDPLTKEDCDWYVKAIDAENDMTDLMTMKEPCFCPTPPPTRGWGWTDTRTKLSRLAMDVRKAAKAKRRKVNVMEKIRNSKSMKRCIREDVEDSMATDSGSDFTRFQHARNHLDHPLSHLRTSKVNETTFLEDGGKRCHSHHKDEKASRMHSMVSQPRRHLSLHRLSQASMLNHQTQHHHHRLARRTLTGNSDDFSATASPDKQKFEATRCDCSSALGAMRADSRKRLHVMACDTEDYVKDAPEGNCRSATGDSYLHGVDERASTPTSGTSKSPSSCVSPVLRQRTKADDSEKELQIQSLYYSRPKRPRLSMDRHAGNNYNGNCR